MQIKNSDKNPITPFAVTNYRDIRKRFGIKEKNRRGHVYIIGKTGTGKSTLIQNMVISDIKDGNGLALIDPHGDIAEGVLSFVPKRRIEDVIYFNPADIKYPIPFNPLERAHPDLHHLVVSGLISAFKHILYELLWNACSYSSLDRQFELYLDQREDMLTLSLYNDLKLKKENRTFSDCQSEGHIKTTKSCYLYRDLRRDKLICESCLYRERFQVFNKCYEAGIGETEGFGLFLVKFYIEQFYGGRVFSAKEIMDRWNDWERKKVRFGFAIPLGEYSWRFVEERR